MSLNALSTAEIMRVATAMRAWVEPAMTTDAWEFVMGLTRERDEARAEVERLRALYADHRKVIGAQHVQILRLTDSTLPITCTLCGVPVEGVRCPDGCQPKIITGEERE